MQEALGKIETRKTKERNSWGNQTKFQLTDKYNEENNLQKKRTLKTDKFFCLEGKQTTFIILILELKNIIKVFTLKIQSTIFKNHNPYSFKPLLTSTRATFVSYFWLSQR